MQMPNVNRGLILESKGDYDRALKDYTESIRLSPEYALPYNVRAWILATCPDGKYRDGKRAVESATEACNLDSDNSSYIDTLAAAYAEAGDFVKAIKYQEEALSLASNDQRQDFQKRLDAYRGHKPWRSD